MGISGFPSVRPKDLRLIVLSCNKLAYQTIQESRQMFVRPNQPRNRAIRAGKFRPLFIPALKAARSRLIGRFCSQRCSVFVERASEEPCLPQSVTS